MITDEFMHGSNGAKIKKVHLLYIDETEKLCDGCDKKRRCASIRTIAGDVVIICKECSQEIVDSF